MDELAGYKPNLEVIEFERRRPIQGRRALRLLVLSHE